MACAMASRCSTALVEPPLAQTVAIAFSMLSAVMKERAVSVWLKAPLDVLMKRVTKRDHRPLLKEDDPQAVMQRLMDERHPIYAEADITIETGAGPHNSAVTAIIEALRAYTAKA